MRFLGRRLALMPLALVIVNFLGFTYAHAAQQLHAAQNPFGSAVEAPPSILRLYGHYVSALIQGNWGTMPTVAAEPIGALLLQTGLVSLGLLLIAFVLSTLLGLVIGVAGVRNQPPRLAPWFTPFTALGLATPGFYLGTIVITLLLVLLIYGNADPELLLPLQGFGWDRHLILPTLALVVRPMAQVAQTTATLLVEELGRPYITAARGRGFRPLRVLLRHAMGNVWPPLLMTMTASLRLLTGELLLVEKLFGWPGLGRLVTTALVPPSTAMVGSMAGAASYFLYPELVAGALTAFALLFLLIDLGAALLVHRLDPRLRQAVAVPLG
ncbi:MAG TPA: ABC transporter permease [Caldilineaceae bacterium]|mgnify:CR=1 FL=1|nr:ABC transporter permease [Caldilineaceae bacterium]